MAHLGPGLRRRGFWLGALLGICTACKGRENPADSSSSTVTGNSSSGGGTVGSASVDSSAASDSPGDGSSGGSSSCRPHVGSPFSLSDRDFGRLSALDLDGDDVPDLLGDRGVGLVGGFEQPSTVVLLDDPPSVSGFGGHFVDTATPGVAYVGADGTVILYPDFDGTAPTTSSISGMVATEVADIDGDGLDDLSILTSSFDTVELWRADGSGGFERLADYVSDGGLPTLGVAPSTASAPALILLGSSDVRGLSAPVGGADKLAVEFTANLDSAYTLAGVEPHDGEQFTFLAATFFQQLTTYNRVGFSMLRDTEWTGRVLELGASESVVVPPVATDLDGDGILDAVIVVVEMGATRLIGACSRGTTMERCADIPLRLAVESLAPAPGPSPQAAWVLGTARDGLWGMASTGCE